MLDNKLKKFQIISIRHGLTILRHDIPEAYKDLFSVLESFSIKNNQIIEGGGGLSTLTKDLRDKFYDKTWMKKNIEEEHIIDGVATKTESHEIDHFKEINDIGIGLEIEWNNKPPFFDRDLANFTRFHRINKINLGIIITRGPNLEKKLYNIFFDHFTKAIKNDREGIMKGLNKMRGQIQEKINKNPEKEIEIISKQYYTSKYGASTTTWKNLINKIKNDLGYPTPLVLVGIEPSVFD